MRGKTDRIMEDIQEVVIDWEFDKNSSSISLNKIKEIIEKQIKGDDGE